MCLQGIEQADHADRNGRFLDEFRSWHPRSRLSLSKPTMKPAVMSILAPYILWMLSAILRRVFCFFFIATRVAGSGLSMPTKNGEEVGRGHHFQKFGIIGQILTELLSKTLKG